MEREVAGLFHDLHITCNTATHGLQDDHASALISLKVALEAFRANEGAMAEQLSATESQALDEQQQWEHLGEQVEADKAALSAQHQALQSAGARQTAAVVSGLRQAARKAAGSIELDEAATRQLIDEQLRQAAWEADNQELRYSKGDPAPEEPQPGHRRMAHQQRPC